MDNQEIIEGFENLKKFIETNDKFIVTAHINPDGDAIGSEIAFASFLTKQKKSARIINSSKTPDNLTFLNPDNEIEVINNEDDVRNKLNINPKEYSVIILDCKEPKRTGKPVEKGIIEKSKNYFVIDHHITEDEENGNSIILPERIATCEILFEIIHDYFWCNIDYKMASALYTGIYTDSGSFVYQRTTARTFIIISELIKAGVEPSYIYKQVHLQARVSKIKLIGRILNDLEYYSNEKIAVLKVKNSTIEEVGAVYEDVDSGDIVTIPLSAEKTVISMFLREYSDGFIKISLRSKDNYNVRAVAQKFGGGGHLNASGVRSKLPIDEISIHLVEELKKLI